MMRRIRTFLALTATALLLATAAGPTLTACQVDPEAARASMEKEVKTDLDEIELKAGKLPAQKNEIMAKVAEFKRELEKVKDDNAKLRALRDRVDKYAQQIAQETGTAPAGSTAATPPVGSKLPPGTPTGGTPTGGMGEGTMGGGTMGGTQPGGKLGGDPGGMGGGGMGGGTLGGGGVGSGTLGGGTLGVGTQQGGGMGGK